MIDIKEYIDGDRFESLSDFSFGDFYTNQISLDINILDRFIKNFNNKRLPLIFVNSERVVSFFNMVRDYDKDFNLISHNGDTIFNDYDVQNKPKCIKKWFGQNINSKNSDTVKSLPIGLERQFWSKKRYGTYGHKHNKIYEYSKLNVNKNKTLYINFDINTNKEKRSWIPEFFKDKGWAHIRMGGIGGNLEKYLLECKESEFILSPNGNGLDCHRNWEMLYLGVTPVVESSVFHKEVYSDLPVLMVNNFKSIDETLFIDETNYPYNKLKFVYWENLILNNYKK